MGRPRRCQAPRAGPSLIGHVGELAPALAHSRSVGEHKPSVDDLDRAMGFILAAVADGHVGVEQARRLIRGNGVVPAAKQIRKATRDSRHDSKTGRSGRKKQK